MSETSPQPWKLTLEDDTKKTEVYSVDTQQTLSIGRELDNDISLDDAHVSRYHARLAWRGNQLVIEDLDTINGTLVNNKRISEPTLLNPGDVISLGAFSLTVDGPEKSVKAYDSTREVARVSLEKPVPQSRQATQVHQVVKPQTGPSNTSRTLILIGLLLLLLLIFGAIAALVLFPALTGSDETAALESTAEATAAATERPALGQQRTDLDVPSVTIDQAPSETSRILVNQPVTVQAAASDVTNITHMELWANGEKVDEISNPLPGGATSMTAILEWSPPEVGTYQLEVRAYNEPGLVGFTPIAVLNVIPGSWSTATPVSASAPTATFTPVPPTPTATSTSTATPPATDTPTPTSTFTTEPSPSPTSEATATNTPSSEQEVIRAPAGRTLLIVSNRSLANQPALLTLSGGRSVGGGQQLDVRPGEDIELVLEPDDYRGLWSTPARDNFTRGVDFTASEGKVIVMWIVPEDGLTDIEIYDQLVVN